jgi:hypothetical protein
MPAPAHAMTSARSLRVRPVATAHEAQQLMIHLTEVMDALVGTVEKETKLVQAGRMREAERVGRFKDDLARLYVADSARIRASRDYLSEKMPDVLDDLRQRHDLFQALFHINLAVLAAAHAVPGYAPSERREPYAA